MKPSTEGHKKPKGPWMHGNPHWKCALIPDLAAWPKRKLIGVQVVVLGQVDDSIWTLHCQKLLSLVVTSHNLVLQGLVCGHQGSNQVYQLQPSATQMGGHHGLHLSLAWEGLSQGHVRHQGWRQKIFLGWANCKKKKKKKKKKKLNFF